METRNLPKWLSSIIGILLAIMAVELILQAIDDNSYQAVVNDTKTGLLTYIPNTSFTYSSRCYKNEVKINSDGFYAPEYLAEKSENTFRILVVGSSFVEAAQVPREQKFTYLLEKKLNEYAKLNDSAPKNTKYEVTPLAFAGNGTYLDLLYYINYGKRLRPNLVLNVATDFELAKNSPSATYPPRFDKNGELILSLPNTARQPAVTKLKNILRNSKLAMNLYLRSLVLKSSTVNLFTKSNIQTAAETNKAIKQISTDEIPSKELWNTQERVLERFQIENKKTATRFALVSWVSDLDNMSGHKNFALELATIARKQKFSYLDLQPIFLDREKTDGRVPYWPCDGHWNQTGHQWASEAIYDFLIARSELIIAERQNYNL